MSISYVARITSSTMSKVPQTRNDKESLLYLKGKVPICFEKVVYDVCCLVDEKFCREYCVHNVTVEPNYEFSLIMFNYVFKYKGSVEKSYITYNKDTLDFVCSSCSVSSEVSRKIVEMARNSFKYKFYTARSFS